MNRQLTGILIDPSTSTVKDFELDYNSEYGYKKVQEAIECSTFSVTRLDKTEVMFIDDEGRLKTHHNGFYLHSLLDTFGHFNRKIAEAQLVFNQLEDGHGDIVDHLKSNARFFVGKALIMSDGGTGETYDTQYSYEKIKSSITLYKLYTTDNDIEVGNQQYGVSFIKTKRPEGFSLYPETKHIDAALI